MSAASSKGTRPHGGTKRAPKPSPKDHVFLQWPVAEASTPSAPMPSCGAWRPWGQEGLCPRAVPRGLRAGGSRWVWVRKLGLSNEYELTWDRQAGPLWCRTVQRQSPGQRGAPPGPLRCRVHWPCGHWGNSQGPVSQCTGQKRGSVGRRVRQACRCWGCSRVLGVPALPHGPPSVTRQGIGK